MHFKIIIPIILLIHTCAGKWEAQKSFDKRAQKLTSSGKLVKREAHELANRKHEFDNEYELVRRESQKRKGQKEGREFVKRAAEFFDRNQVLNERETGHHILVKREDPQPSNPLDIQWTDMVNQRMQSMFETMSKMWLKSIRFLKKQFQMMQKELYERSLKIIEESENRLEELRKKGAEIGKEFDEYKQLWTSNKDIFNGAISQVCVEVIPDEPCPQPEFSADSVDRYLVDVYSRFAMFRQVINEKIISHLNTSLGMSLTNGMQRFQEKLCKIQDSLNQMWDKVKMVQINGTESMGSFTDFRKAIAREFFNVKEYLTVFRNNGKSLVDDAIKKSKDFFRTIGLKFKSQEGIVEAEKEEIKNLMTTFSSHMQRAIENFNQRDFNGGNIISTKKTKRSMESVNERSKRRSKRALNRLAQFMGLWRLSSSENFEAYVKEIGISFLVRNVVTRLEPTIEFRTDGDDEDTDDELEYIMTIRTTLKAKRIKFRLGRQFDERRADRVKYKSVIIEKDGQLIESQSHEGKGATIVREIIDGKLVETYKSGDVQAKRTYDKV